MLSKAPPTPGVNPWDCYEYLREVHGAEMSFDSMRMPCRRPSFYRSRSCTKGSEMLFILLPVEGSLGGGWDVSRMPPATLVVPLSALPSHQSLLNVYPSSTCFIPSPIPFLLLPFFFPSQCALLSFLHMPSSSLQSTYTHQAYYSSTAPCISYPFQQAA